MAGSRIVVSQVKSAMSGVDQARTEGKSRIQRQAEVRASSRQVKVSSKPGQDQRSNTGIRNNHL